MNSLAIRAATFGTILGTVILAWGIAASILFHGVNQAGPFSLLNHFVSELGWISRSPLAPVFNGSVAVGSLFFAPVMWALGLHFHTRLGYIAAGCGLASIAAASAVGWLSMDDIQPHLMATLLYFCAWLATVSLFTRAFCQEKSSKGSRIMVALGLLSILSCLLLLACPKNSLITAIQAIQRHEPFYRPEIWWLAVIEWVVVFCMWLWIAAVTTLLWWTRKAGKPNAFPPSNTSL